jgi:hypothetical protein
MIGKRFRKGAIFQASGRRSQLRAHMFGAEVLILDADGGAG